MKAEKPNLIQSVMSAVIEPGIQRLLATPYFTELRSGTLSRARIQGWALQHYLYNITIAKGQVICMFKYAHDPELYGAFAEKFTEEQHIRISSCGSALRWASRTRTFKERGRLLRISCT